MLVSTTKGFAQRGSLHASLYHRYATQKLREKIILHEIIASKEVSNSQNLAPDMNFNTLDPSLDTKLKSRYIRKISTGSKASMLMISLTATALIYNMLFGSRDDVSRQ